MIMVDIHLRSAERITSVVVSDHAGFAEDGSDLICAAASTLV